MTKEVVGAFERRIPFIPVLMGVRPSELKEKQPEWRHALGGTAMLCCGERGLSSTIPRVIEGLRALGIEPGERKISTTSTLSAPAYLTERILSTRSLIAGERKQVAVLCAGVSVPDSISERLDPEEVQDLIRPYMGAMQEGVFQTSPQHYRSCLERHGSLPTGLRTVLGPLFLNVF